MSRGTRGESAFSLYVQSTFLFSTGGKIFNLEKSFSLLLLKMSLFLCVSLCNYHLSPWIHKEKLGRFLLRWMAMAFCPWLAKGEAISLIATDWWYLNPLRHVIYINIPFSMFQHGKHLRTSQSEVATWSFEMMKNRMKTTALYYRHKDMQTRVCSHVETLGSATKHKDHTS